MEKKWNTMCRGNFWGNSWDSQWPSSVHNTAEVCTWAHLPEGEAGKHPTVWPGEGISLAEYPVSATLWCSKFTKTLLYDYSPDFSSVPKFKALNLGSEKPFVLFSTVTGFLGLWENSCIWANFLVSSYPLWFHFSHVKFKSVFLVKMHPGISSVNEVCGRFSRWSECRGAWRC